MRRLRKLAWIAIVGLLVCPVVLAADEKAEREAVVSSFKQYVKDYVDSYKTDRREQVHDIQGRLGNTGTWVIGSFGPVRDGYSIDIRKTDSLISPYVGVLEFELVGHETRVHASKEEALADNDFGPETEGFVIEHRHTYAFQDGKWVPKSRQRYDGIDKEWEDCVPHDGCLESDKKTH